MRSEKPPFLVVIVGPTAVGKTELAIDVAERVGGEIISADSKLFYRGMDIGTAKPGLKERARVRHHLIDIADPDQSMSLAVFQKLARKTIEEIWGANRIPVLVGGTGQFVRAVVEEWAIPPQPPDQRVRSALQELAKVIGPVELHRKLMVIDPEAARLIEPNNLRRTVRALEVIFLTGQLFSAQRIKHGSPYRLCQVGLLRPRDALYRRVDERIERMIGDGLLQETQMLLDKGFSKDLPSLSAIGYSEMIAVLNGEIALDEAVTFMKRRTRNFIRRQANWFKLDDATIKWFTVGEDTVSEVTLFILERLAETGDKD